MATAMPNNVGSGSQRASGSGSGIEPDEDSKQSARTKSYASVAGTGGPASSASQAAAVTGSGAKDICDKEKSKIGHRRVNERGEITFKKVTTNHLMGSIQLGIGQAIATRIGQAIGTLTKYDERDLLMQDFMTVETTHFAKGGSSQTPAHSFSDFTFKTYAPLAFRYFLNLFGIQRDDFLVSLCSKQMRELSNPGASGSIFYLTYDDEFILKTVQHKEAEFLQKLLPGYYMNLNQNPHTLLPKFFGMYIYQCNQKNIRIIVMNNLLPSNIKMHLKFDLKGSTFKRKANKSERAKSSPTFKDLDFMEILPEGLMLEAETYNALITTMRRDCRVLESFRIMDYSLLIGIHNLDQAAKEQAESTGGVSPTREQARREAERKMQRYTNKQKLVGTTMESIQAQTEPIDEQDHLPPGGIPARNHKGERLLIYLGIIDILQSYRMQKKLEHVIKSIIHDGDSVSVHRPGFYAHRFLDFMADKVFKKIPSLDLPEVSGTHRKFRSIVSSLIALKHSPSKRGKRESVKNSTSSKLENSNSPEATATVVGASNATSTTGPTPAAPNGGATTTQGTGTRPDVVPGPSDTTDAPLPTFETFRNEPASSNSKYDGSRPKHKRQDQVKQLSYNHSSLGDLHCDYDTSSVNYGTPSHLSIGTSSLNTATWTEEAQPSFTDSSISGSLGRASADPGRISKMETISSSNHVTSSSLGSRLNYNNSTPHRRTPSPRSPYTSAIITNIREDGKIERRLETCSYQETEM